MADDEVHLSINLASLHDGLTLNVQRVSRYVATALEAPVGQLTAPLHVQGRSMGFQYDPPLAWSEEEAKREFDTWILLNAFRDLAEVTTHFLGSVHSVAGTAQLQEIQSSAGHIRPEQWQQVVVEAEARFERANLPDKLRLLSTERSLTVPSDALVHVASLYRVRNCLVHRGGLVQKQDVDDANRLVAKWLAINPYLVIGGVEEPLVIPRDIDAGSVIRLKNELSSKTFALGERVAFDAAEFHEIAQGFALLGKQVVHALEQRLRQAGIAFPEGPAV